MNKESGNATKIWKFLNVSTQNPVPTETVQSGVDAAKAVFELSEVLQKSDVQSVAPLVERIASLLDVLNSPLGQVVEAGLPFFSVATKLLKIYLESTKQEPTFVQCVALVSQAAYLESFQETFTHQDNQALLKRIGQMSSSSSAAQQIKQLGELNLEYNEACKAAIYFHSSKLATAFNTMRH